LNPLRVLVVSYAFPPYAKVGSIRIAQFCQYLPEFGIEPIVLSVEERFYESLDRSRTVSSSLRLLRAHKIANPIEWLARAKQRLTLARHPNAKPESGPAGIRKETGWFRRNLRALSEIPDREWGWYLPAAQRVDEFLRHEQVDAVFSSGPPWTSHLVARRVKNKFGIPWLADFRDPWANSTSAQTKPAWWHQLAVRLERSCIQKADMVLCNTNRLRDSFRSHYPDLKPAKFQTLTNGFEDLPAPAEPAIDRKRTLLHLGSIYGHRRIDTFLSALARLVHSGRIDAQSLRVIFQGDVDSSRVAEAVKILPDLVQRKCVQFLPRIPWEEAWKLLWQSDLLLLFQGGHELQVPAKFYEYLQTGIPMFAVTEEGALSDALQATDSGIWVKPDDPDVIAEGLLRALRLPKQSAQDVARRLSGQYHYRGLTQQLSSWIREMAGQS
jgi:glycosyltransferase involved in cell wall biosynthesis